MFFGFSLPLVELYGTVIRFLKECRSGFLIYIVKRAQLAAGLSKDKQKLRLGLKFAINSLCWFPFG
ncbi:hypothetical protein AXX12_13470 [Anaerosporomusa subterranea]|uniref:Uncharacterized protein n=1 Tax=Anaerosporomusa subterranea TaxID=1794912 RepID=A0A154BMG3_ANASB|nr:hypothetical protein AXX12_13470 [Anaerosporomusa subterranea]